MSTDYLPDDEEGLVYNNTDMEPNIEILQNRIRERIELLGTSARGVSIRIGGSPDAVRAIYRGGWPAVDKLWLIAADLKCNPDYLMGNTDDPDPDAPPISIQSLKTFIEEAFKHRGDLSDDDLSDLAAQAYAEHLRSGMTVEEFRRVLQFHRPLGKVGESHSDG